LRWWELRRYEKKRGAALYGLANMGGISLFVNPF
jgi:hypothetical protein